MNRTSLFIAAFATGVACFGDAAVTRAQAPPPPEEPMARPATQPTSRPTRPMGDFRDLRDFRGGPEQRRPLERRDRGGPGGPGGPPGMDEQDGPPDGRRLRERRGPGGPPDGGGPGAMSEPGERPIGREGPAGRDRGPEGDGAGGQPRGPARMAPPSPEEWEEIEAFATENSPRRLAKINEMRDGDRRDFMMAQAFIVGRFRAIDAMKERDPDLYARRIEVMKLEDKVFGEVEDGAVAADAPAEKKVALREDVKKLVALHLAEREERINRMNGVLDEQKKKLDDDKQQQDKLVDERMADIERAGVDGLLPSGPARRFMERRRAGGDGGERPEQTGRPERPEFPPPPPADGAGPEPR